MMDKLPEVIEAEALLEQARAQQADQLSRAIKLEEQARDIRDAIGKALAPTPTPEVAALLALGEAVG